MRQQRTNGSQRWQIYFDARSRDELRFDVLDKTLDLDFNQHLTLSNGGERVWGVGYRRLPNRTDGIFVFSIAPDKSTEDLFTAFIQQSWRFFDQRLQLTLGSKFEHSSRVEFHAQPSARLAWQINAQSMVWGSVSRAVSTPSLAETNGTLMFSAGTLGGYPLLLPCWATAGSMLKPWWPTSLAGAGGLARWLASMSPPSRMTTMTY